MNEKQVAHVLDGEAWIEYLGNLYEHIGFENGKHIFMDVNDQMRDPLLVTDKELRQSTKFYYYEKY